MVFIENNIERCIDVAPYHASVLDQAMDGRGKLAQIFRYPCRAQYFVHHVFEIVASADTPY
jgi:hypothetical protein